MSNEDNESSTYEYDSLNPNSYIISMDPSVMASVQIPNIPTTGTFVVKAEVRVTGKVSDYDDNKIKNLEAVMATIANVQAEDVSVTLRAGSVIVTYIITTNKPKEVFEQVAVALQTKEMASKSLQLDVLEKPTVEIVPVTAASCLGLPFSCSVLGIMILCVVVVVMIVLNETGKKKSM
jgi:hypothetical protein